MLQRERRNMDQQPLILWGFAGCAGGFIFLVTWIIHLSIEIQNRVTYKWIEDTFKKQLDANLVQIEKACEEIKVALVGTMDKKGIVTKIHEHEDRINDLEEGK